MATNQIIRYVLLALGIICLFLSGIGFTHPRVSPKINFMSLGFAFIASYLYVPLE